MGFAQVVLSSSKVSHLFTSQSPLQASDKVLAINNKSRYILLASSIETARPLLFVWKMQKPVCQADALS